MKQTAGNMGADLLIIDTGDLHDGTGLSDASAIDGTESMPIFDEIDYDLLTIGETAPSPELRRSKLLMMSYMQATMSYM